MSFLGAMAEEMVRWHAIQWSNVVAAVSPADAGDIMSFDGVAFARRPMHLVAAFAENHVTNSISAETDVADDNIL